jgi:hypothetical protein
LFLLTPVDHPSSEVIKYEEVLALLVLCCQPRQTDFKAFIVREMLNTSNEIVLFSLFFRYVDEFILVFVRGVFLFELLIFVPVSRTKNVFLLPREVLPSCEDSTLIDYSQEVLSVFQQVALVDLWYFLGAKGLCDPLAFSIQGTYPALLG